MKLIRVAAAVVNQTPLDWRGNQARVVAALRAARDRGVSVLCLPELCLSGYGCEDAFQSPNTHRQSLRVLGEILPETRGMVVAVGLPLLLNNGLFNVAALLVDGRLCGLVAKQHLAGDGIHYEPRWFKAWPAGVKDVISVDLQGAAGVVECPVGDVYFEVGGVRFGFEICEDAWVASRPGIRLAQKAVDVILNPSASHFAFGKIEVRKRFVLEGSRAFGVTYVYANLLGNEAGRAIYDGEGMIASAGQMLAAGTRFSYADFQVTDAVVDVDATRLQQARLASFRPGLGEDLHEVNVPGFVWPPVAPARASMQTASWERSAHLKEEEFTRAVGLALFDYLRKSRSRGFVVSLSGGADSSSIACLVALMVRTGCAELGRAGFVSKLAHIAGLDSAGGVRGVRDEQALVGALLTTAYQATRNSGGVTRAAARAVAEAVGAEHHEWEISALHEGYVAMVQSTLGRDFSWATDDVALQNIQARVRSPGIWLLTNVKGALLLSTSNRSEAAVGYATMDGDTSGGLAPIAGIDKAWLRRWLVWLEHQGPEGLGPIPALHAVNVQAPTAELRPQESGQTDEADLMPYTVLDAVERCAIRDKRSPIEAYQEVRLQFPEYSAKQLAFWVERFFRLWCRNQWKRERYAPSFHLDDENLDPRTWCRFPILSGGFEVELEELRKFVDAES